MEATIVTAAEKPTQLFGAREDQREDENESPAVLNTA